MIMRLFAEIPHLGGGQMLLGFGWRMAGWKYSIDLYCFASTRFFFCLSLREAGGILVNVLCMIAGRVGEKAPGGLVRGMVFEGGSLLMGFV